MTGRLRRTPEAAVARAPGPESDLREKAATRVPDAESVLRKASVTPASPADHHAGARPADGPTPASRGLLAQELTHVVARMADGGAQEPSEREAERTADEVAQGHHVGPPRESPDTGPDPERQPTSLTEVLSDPGPGQPLPAATRDLLESRMGADLGDVRLHTDHRANTAAADLEARAFTYGSDVYLAAGSSPHDIGLMAHEATHVLQQRGGEPRVHRASSSGKPPAAKKANQDTPDPDDKSRVEGEAVFIEPLILPSWKVHWPGTVPGKPIPLVNVLVKKRDDVIDSATGKRDTHQTKNWDKHIEKKVGDALDAKVPTPADQIYALKHRNSGSYVIGTRADVVQRIGRPAWDDAGKTRIFNVDHFQEIQLGGLDDATNYLLLEAGPNQLAGSLINTQINRRIRWAYAKSGIRKTSGEVRAIRESGKVTVTRVAEGALGNLPKTQPPFWTVNDVADPEKGPLRWLEILGEDEKKKIIGTKGDDFLLIVTHKTVGSALRIPWDASKKEPRNLGEVRQYPGLNITKLTYDPDEKKGLMTANIFGKESDGEDEESIGQITAKRQKMAGIELQPFPLLGRAVMIDENYLEAKLRKFELWGMSPVDVVSAELDDSVGLRVHGVLRPSIPLLQGRSIDIVAQGHDLTFEMTFEGDALTLPPPLRITEGSLTVSAGITGGAGRLGLSGQLGFAVDRLGTGTLAASVSTSDGFGLRGGFDFDSELFEQAHLDIHYRRKNKDDFSFGGKGILAIGPNKVRGIRKASVTAAFENDAFSAAGTAELDIPGVKSGTFEVRQDPKEGFAATGAFQLADNIPGIRSGELSASVVKNPVDNRWKISARGSAVPAIPGVDAHITAQYDDGAFTLEGSAAYAKGMLHGSLLIGVTNRPVTPEGQPAGPPGKDLTAYGEGSVTARLAPWLQGTVGIRILRRGEVELVGTIALPDTLKLFEARNLERNILRIGLDIPIVGVSVLGHRVGIFATISGALDADAGIGPGELRKLALAITYNPAREDQTKVTGDARLFIPAHAGLRLSVRGALGAGIPLVSAEAGLEIGGRLGIEGAVDASLHIDWTPAKGLVLDAEAKVSAEPAFTFDVAGYALVEADLLLRTVELYSKRWELAKVAYGSGLRIGLTFPLHYEQGKPFEPSLTDARLELPEIDPRQVIGDLVRRIA